MPYINTAQITGNLGKDAETTDTQSGKTVTRFDIASTKKWTDKDGKQHEATDWFRIAAWGTLTKFASVLKKGEPVLVQGQLRTGEYTDENGIARKTVEIVADTIFRIDYSKTANDQPEPDRGDAYEPEVPLAATSRAKSKKSAAK